MHDLLQVDWSSVPAPIDNGAAADLIGRTLPNLELPRSSGGRVNLAALRGITVIFIYPRARRPGVAASATWQMTPGAKGCTPQACSFRDEYENLLYQGVERLYGLSSQSIDEQSELIRRLDLPYAMLSDEQLTLASIMNLPTLSFEGTKYFARLTMVVSDSTVRHVIYPVFPPDKNAESVLDYLRRGC